MMMWCVDTVQVYSSGELTGYHEVRVYIIKTKHTKQNIISLLNSLSSLCFLQIARNS